MGQASGSLPSGPRVEQSLAWLVCLPRCLCQLEIDRPPRARLAAWLHHYTAKQLFNYPTHR